MSPLDLRRGDVRNGAHRHLTQEGVIPDITTASSRPYRGDAGVFSTDRPTKATPSFVRRR